MTSPIPDQPGSVLEAFAAAYGGAPDGVWRAPGRVNLIGEHTDYNEGFVLPFAIDRSARVAVRARPDRRVRLASTYGREGVVDLGPDGITREAARGWTVYPVGVVWALRQRGVEVPGFDLVLDSNVPLGSGLSSSHAIECAVAIALAELSGAQLSTEELVLLTQRAENDFVGAPTGIMDQSASLRATAGHAVFLDCRDQHAELIPFDAPAAGLTVLVVDTKVAHSHADGGYASRRAACELGAEVLGVDALRDVASADLTEARGLLDEVTFRRVRHVVTENERVLRTVEVLRSEGPAAIGPLLDESHASMRDDFEISCPELDLAVETARASGAVGARMTGGGFGGSAIALVPTTAERAVRDDVAAAFARAGYREPEVFSVSPADGARRLL
ncbi:galactokinase [Sinomonas atrocyanea]|uniref:galactokinase n=1 Tax=Sinomonas atrocyanea TaxID=37927 RepID=UPI003D96DA8D